MDKYSFCSGCGVCAAVCPINNIEIIKINGSLKASKIGNCLKGCNLCEKTCSLNDSSFLEDYGFKEKIMGKALKCYAGHLIDDNSRISSASGGLTTGFIEYLMDEKIIDAVICVKKNSGENKYSFFIADTVEKVRESKGSSYYTVSANEVLKRIEGDDKKYALIGVPCLIGSIKKAKTLNNNFFKNILYLFSLSCGQMMNHNYPNYLMYKDNYKNEVDWEICFRCKNPKETANIFYTRIIKNNKILVNKSCSDQYPIWKYYMFTQESCLFCEDFFGITADITLMDAWLPQYYSDWKGNNIVIIRNKDLLNQFEKFAKSKAYIKEIDESDVIKSQSSRVNDKKNVLSGRLYLAKKNGVNIIRNTKASEKSLTDNAVYIYESFKCNVNSNIYIDNILKQKKLYVSKILLKFYEWKIINLDKNYIIRKLYESYYGRKTS